MYTTPLSTLLISSMSLNPWLFDMALKNLGILGFKKNLKNLKSPNLGFLGF